MNEGLDRTRAVITRFEAPYATRGFAVSTWLEAPFGSACGPVSSSFLENELISWDVAMVSSAHGDHLRGFDDDAGRGRGMAEPD